MLKRLMWAMMMGQVEEGSRVVTTRGLGYWALHVRLSLGLSECNRKIPSRVDWDTLIPYDYTDC